MENNIIMHPFNDTQSKYPSDNTVIELFEEQAIKNNNKIALVHNSLRITYGSLYEKANKIAAYIRGKGVEKEKVVAVMIDQGIDRIATILGILKAGGAYLPVDKNYPASRIEYMLRDSGAKILITDKGVNLDFDGDIINWQEISMDNLNNVVIESGTNSSSLMYIIYTSGSTGNPKGVMVEQKNVVRLVKNTNYLDFQEDDKVLQGGSIQFDASIFEIWGALLNGLELHLVEKEMMLDSDMLGQYFKKEKITILWMTSPLFNNISEQDPTIFNKLRFLLVGGDTLSTKHIERVRRECINLKIVNGYGPTENTTFSTFFLIDRKYTKSIPIGRPISNSTAYIMDKNLNVLPDGEVGELCVGGDGVSRGYINNPNLTSEKFISNPPHNIGRIYRTGDLARILPDGNIEFCGRIDKQVKIRGFRIELGEIEREILSHQDSSETVVLVQEDDHGKYLFAYFSGKKRFQSGHLRKHLMNKLPPHMIPTHIIKVDKMPYNISGKIDAEKLLEIEANQLNPLDTGDMNPIERKLIELFKSEIKNSHIGVSNSFYDSGLDSLMATKLLLKIKKQFKVNIKVRDILDNYTIGRLARRLEKLEEISESEVPTLVTSDYYETSSAQKRVYMANQSNEDLSYNIPMMIKFTNRIDLPILQEALNKLVKRHESLRTTFHFINDVFYQKVNQDVHIEVESFRENREDLLDEDIKAYLETFNLDALPLLSAKVISLNTSDVLLVNIHHIVFDGLSVQVFIDEIMALYNGEELRELSFQYKEYSEWHNKLKQTDDYKNAKEYWVNKFLPLPLPLALPYGRDQNEEKNEHNFVDILVDNQVINRSKAYLTEKQTSLYVFFISVLSVLLAKYSNEEDIVITSVSEGRSRHEFQNLIGMFVDTFPIRCQVNDASAFIDLLFEIRNTVMEAHEHNYQYEDLVYSLTRKSKHKVREINKLFNIMMVLDSPTNINNKEVLDVNTLLSTGTSKFDITLIAMPTKNGYKFRIEYDVNLFSRKTMEGFLNNYRRLLCKFAENPKQLLAEVEIIKSDGINPVSHPDFSMENSTNNQTPQTDVQEIMVDVWREVLNKNTLGVADCFFELGGDSIKAIQISSRLQKKGLTLKVNNILIHRTIEKVSEFVVVKQIDYGNEIVLGNIELTPIQQWYFNKEVQNRNHYNQSVLLKCENRIKLSEVKRIFKEIVKHHDVLRTVFSKTNGPFRQFNRGISRDAFTINTYSFEEGDDLKKIIFEKGNCLQTELDIEKGKLINLGIFTSNEECYLLIIIHHLVIDEVSWHILLEDLTLGYKQLKNHIPIDFGNKTESYLSYSRQLIKHALDGGFNEEKDYWMESIKRIEDYSHGEEKTQYLYSENNDIHLYLSKAETDSLIHEAHRPYNTQIQDLLLAALALSVKGYNDKSYFVCDVESHGRENIYEHTEITRTIGWFTSIYPVAIPVTDVLDLKGTIINIKEKLRGVPRNGIGYGALRYILKDEDFTNNRAKICFNYLGIVNDVTEDEMFAISPIKKGNEIGENQISDYFLEINCQIIHSRLEVIVSCSKSVFSESEAERLADNFKDTLLNLINHCTGQEHSEVTPSDLSSKSIDMDFMEEIFLALND